MQLNIKNPKAYEMAKELSRLTGESMSQAVVHALEARLAEERERCLRDKGDLAERLLAIGRELSKHPVYDDRHPDDMLYDADGLPKVRDDG